MSSANEQVASWRPGRAASWATLTTVVLVVGSLLPIVLSDRGGSPGHPMLSVQAAESLVLAAVVPVVFGTCFVLALLILRWRRS